MNYTKWIVCVCKSGEYFNMSPQEIKNKFFLFNLDRDVEFSEPFKRYGKFYHSCCRMPKDKIWIVEEFTPKKDEDVYEWCEEREITCPYCGNQNNDSWEAGDGEEEQECANCSSTFSWQKELNITYTSQPVKKHKIKGI